MITRALRSRLKDLIILIKKNKRSRNKPALLTLNKLPLLPLLIDLNILSKKKRE